MRMSRIDANDREVDPPDSKDHLPGLVDHTHSGFSLRDVQTDGLLHDRPPNHSLVITQR
jgi:hypothetical protein